MKVLASMFAVAALLASTKAFAYGGDFLGQTRLSFGKDMDTIHVAGRCPSPANRPIRAIRLEVENRGAEIDHVAVAYGNGVWDRLPVREYFNAGTKSRWIDLRGGARCVEKIRIVGDTEAFLPIGQRALVQVYGSR